MTLRTSDHLNSFQDCSLQRTTDSGRRSLTRSFMICKRDDIDNIVEERKSLEVEAIKKIEWEKCLAEQRAFDLEKLKLQAQNPPASAGNSPQMDYSPMRLDLKTVLPAFIPDKDDISLFLTMFERTIKLLNVPADFWISHLIGVIPSDISGLIAREPEEMFRNYAHIPNILLQRFELTVSESFFADTRNRIIPRGKISFLS
ncbi:transposon Ty3-I Gag-Pol polyprotein [Trichonephila inaurata madagascariensis]|uniref:Transposon Ty3-I Gag-Pol polyprotein n=1 Tax=Trichonephila inaurata madagascariensis TaxID=2747483 RepID=A0A8X7CT11_9ARAC|nr:transposon Ty3-I Gag-Pol polyprotein [Trichonephila inaurata madagascariensis]